MPHHGFPAQKAEAGLNVVAAVLTFGAGVVVQDSTGDPLQGQITCRSTKRQSQRPKPHTHQGGRRAGERKEGHVGLGLRR